jgi:signal transduction histidine kinase
MVDVTLKKGVSPLSSYAFTMYGVNLIIAFEDYENGYNMGITGLEMDKRFNYPAISGLNHFSFATFISHWKDPLNLSIVHLRNALAGSQEGGDFMFSAYAISNLLMFQSMAGLPIGELKEELRNLGSLADRINEPSSKDTVQMFEKFTNELGGGNSETETDFDEKEFEESHKKLNPVILAYYYLSRSLRDVAMNRLKDSVHTADTLKLLATMASGIPYVRYTIYYSILLVHRIRESSEAERKAAATEIAGFASASFYRSEISRRNLKHFHSFLLALKADLEEDLSGAMTHYDQAIQGAVTLGEIHNEAIFMEEAAGFHIRHHRKKMGLCYLVDAKNAFERWGAHAAVQRMENSYPELRAIRFNVAESSTSSESTDFSQSIDFSSVFKATRQISRQLNREDLLQSMIQIMMENSGAEKSALILKQNNRWMIAAFRQVGIEKHRDMPTALEEVDDLPVSLIKYIIRSDEELILSNAASERRFRDESYFKNNSIRSVLCIPVHSHGKTEGALYLENDLAEGVFTRNHIMILKTLLSQASVALENAELFSRLEEVNRDLENRVQDEVERNRQKDQLMIQQMRRADISELLTTIAHQWRQPLNTIGLMVQNIGEEREKSIPESIDRIMKILDDLSKTIEFFSEFYSQEKDREHFEIASVIQKTVALIDKFFLSRNITIEISSGYPGMVMGYSGRFSQALLNILTNSREAYERNGTGGAIRILTENNVSEKVIHIKIEDEAGGVPPSIQKKMFEPYFTTKSTQAHGYGLGLYTARIIIESTMNGKISVNNTGKGISFDIYLPEA